MKSHYYCLIALLAGLPVTPGWAQQELTLFESTEDEQEQQSRVRRQQSSRNVPSEPKFTLKSASRFGDVYKVTLQDEDGQSVTVEWTAGRGVRLQGYGGFTVAEVGRRKVSINYPESEPCVEFPEQGVSCTPDGQSAILSLRTAEPVETRRGEAENGDRTEMSGTSGDGARNVVVNPFSGETQEIQQLSEEERRERAERQAARAERLRNIEPRRIDPEDVPPGMRVVRTPFGDRLVPDDGRED